MGTQTQTRAYVKSSSCLPPAEISNSTPKLNRTPSTDHFRLNMQIRPEQGRPDGPTVSQLPAHQT